MWVEILNKCLPNTSNGSFSFHLEKLSIENKATLIKNVYINIYSNNSVPRTKRRLDPKSAAGNSQFSAALVY